MLKQRFVPFLTSIGYVLMACGGNSAAPETPASEPGMETPSETSTPGGDTTNAPPEDIPGPTGTQPGAAPIPGTSGP